MSTSSTPLWGQAWELSIQIANSPDLIVVSYKTWTPEALRITFDVMQAAISGPIWYADISIYNLENDDAQTILSGAVHATLSAGFMTDFQNGANPIIWDGPVFQTLFTREGVVDQKLTLHCIASPLSEINDNIVAFAAGPYASQTSIAARMMSQIGLPPLSLQQGTLSQLAEQRMNAVQFPRGNTIFGKTGKFIAQMADHNFLQTFSDGKNQYITDLTNGDAPIDLIYAPPFPPGYTAQFLDLPAGTTQSLIGTPQQTPEGAIFTVLLDARLKVQLPALLVQLAATQVTQLQRTPVIGEQPTGLLTPNLTFFVSQVRHTGDSRGNDWHTEVTGFSTVYIQTWLAQLGI